MTKQEEIREGIAYDVSCIVDCKLCQSECLDNQKLYCPEAYRVAGEIMQRLHSQGAVIKGDRELPEKLANNIGCMSKSEIEDFATMVLEECGYPYTMKWTTAGDIVIEPFIYIDERHIDEYPYMVKERVLHEVAHIDTHPQDDRHGELFHRRYAELVNRFLAGYVAVEPLIEE